MAAAISVIKREADLDRRESQMRASARIQRMKDDADRIVQGLKKRVETVKDSSKTVVAVSGVLRTGGIFLEAYAKKKVAPETAKKLGPAATIAAIAGYAIGLYSDKPSDSAAAFAVASFADGMSSRFMVETADKTFADV